MTSSVLVKFPTRSRPDLFFRTLSLWATDPAARFLISIDEDDAACNNNQFLSAIETVAPGRDILVRVGNSRGKVEAVNDGLNDEPWDSVLIVASDDMVPQRPDAASCLARLLLERFPDGDGVLHTDDGRTGRTLNTLPVCGRKYFDRFGYVYAPCYTSVFCDDELQAVSESLGRAAYVDEVIVKHDWIGATAPDDLHRRNESFYGKDGRVFEERKAAGFPTVSVVSEPDRSTST